MHDLDFDRLFLEQPAFIDADDTARIKRSRAELETAWFDAMRQKIVSRLVTQPRLSVMQDEWRLVLRDWW